MKTLNCKEAGAKDCDAVITGQTEDEVMLKAREHAKSVHGMTDQQFNEDIGDLRPLIHDEKAA